MGQKDQFLILYLYQKVNFTFYLKSDFYLFISITWKQLNYLYAVM